MQYVCGLSAGLVAIGVGLAMAPSGAVARFRQLP